MSDASVFEKIHRDLGFTVGELIEALGAIDPRTRVVAEGCCCTAAIAGLHVNADCQLVLETCPPH